MRKAFAISVLAFCFIAMIAMAQDYTSGQKEILAYRAATADAYRSLLGIIKGFSIESKTTVRNFVAENDQINSRLDGFVRGAKEVGRHMLPSGEAVVEIEVDIAELNAILGKSVHYSEPLIHATGHGAPPSNTSGYQSATLADSPKDTIIRMTGEGAYPEQRTDLSSAQKTLMAKRAAELDAMRRLTEYIYGLRLSSGTTVRDFVTQADYIKTNVDAFLKGARVEEERDRGNGIYEVTVAVDAETLRGLFD